MFKKLVARDVSFTSGDSKDQVSFSLKDGHLELRVNGFAKAISVLRIQRACAMVLDQDTWATTVPTQLFDQIVEKLRRLASAANVPILDVHGKELKPRAQASSKATALLQLSPELRVSWLESQSCEVCAGFGAGSLEAVARWVNGQARLVLAVEASLESQLLAAQPCAAALLRVPHGGAEAFLLAAVLAQLQCPVVLVTAEDWAGCDEIARELCHVLAELEAGEAARCSTQAQRIWSTAGAAERATTLLEDALSAYRASRPYVHGLIGAGILEADVREALEASVDLLQSSEVQSLTVKPRHDGRPPNPRALHCIGRASRALGKLAEDRLGDLWFQPEADPGPDAFCVLDLSDSESLEFLRQRQQQEVPSIHVLALLPASSMHRAAWDVVAEPLAVLVGAGEELLPDVGLVVAVCLGDPAGDAGDVLSLLEVLATAPLAAVAFQLQPRPQSHVMLPAQDVGGAYLLPSGQEVSREEVDAAFSFWPRCSEPRLLSAEMLRPGLPASLACAGAAYVPSARTKPRVWHLLLHVHEEAKLFRRAAGDFPGRASAAFRWRGGAGPKCDLWSLATALEGETSEDRSEQDEQKDDHAAYSEEEYEGELHAMSRSERIARDLRAAEAELHEGKFPQLTSLDSEDDTFAFCVRGLDGAFTAVVGNPYPLGETQVYGPEEFELESAGTVSEIIRRVTEELARPHACDMELIADASPEQALQKEVLSAKSALGEEAVALTQLADMWRVRLSVPIIGLSSTACAAWGVDTSRPISVDLHLPFGCSQVKRSMLKRIWQEGSFALETQLLHILAEFCQFFADGTADTWDVKDVEETELDDCNCAVWYEAKKKRLILEAMEAERAGFLTCLARYLQLRVPTVHEFCAICDKPFQVAPMMMRSVCSDELCTYQFVEFGSKITTAESVNHRSEIMDLLFCMLAAAAKSPRRELILDPFPAVHVARLPVLSPDCKDFAKLETCVDELQKIRAWGAGHLGASWALCTGQMTQEAAALLKWTVCSNRCYLAPLQEHQLVQAFRTQFQYLLVSAPPDKEARFNKLKEQFGTSFAFHGSASENWHSILRNGLKNASHTKLMTSGARFGPGIYLSQESSVSRAYCRGMKTHDEAGVKRQKTGSLASGSTQGESGPGACVC
ncbi:unnamed protein product [Effrenium voratum]|uniref:Poly [ADP-ribose] polymerase n=1 Tax=Effrenium voratum TaxID=2562239 RepID=A0AA36JN99_9DINO|nr:unnamed protein product [Effrenium voratum]